MNATHWAILAVAVLAWIGFWMWVVPVLGRRIRIRLEARLGDTATAGAIDLLNLLYVRWWHRLELVGFRDLPAPFRAGDRGAGLVVANHTAGIDPLLVQAGIRRFIRWMMWADMMIPELELFWRTARILPVSYGTGDSTTVRTALRHLKDGGLVGLFAEGSIARPPREIRPFQPGVGLLARLSKAPVLLIHIRDTPYTPTAFGSIIRRSRAVVEVIGIHDLSGEKDPRVATERLRSALLDHSGWPSNEETLIVMAEPQEEESPSVA
ncbi:MAG: 1-acyl-sn-glycerol-3-phosphate acyltransferase [Phycisphaera sp.]|nr:1-acyl-sn-glycerol-3-phosphate acyltransferase [Phycisphaera sp.]